MKLFYKQTTEQPVNKSTNQQTINKMSTQQLQKIPTFRRPIDNSGTDLTCRVQFTSEDISKICNLFAGYTLPQFNTPLTDYVRNFIEIQTENYVYNSIRITVIPAYKVMIIVERLRTHLQEIVSHPYNYVSYGRTKTEIYDILDKFDYQTNYSDHRRIMQTFESMLTITETPHEQFRKVFPLNIQFLIAEILMTRKFATMERMVLIIRREVDYLNEHRDHAIERLTGKQHELILRDIERLKETIGKLSKQYCIYLPNDLINELSGRSERIFRILTLEKKIEDDVSPNVKQVIQNSDLNRYLMGFIN